MLLKDPALFNRPDDRQAVGPLTHSHSRRTFKAAGSLQHPLSAVRGPSGWKQTILADRRHCLAGDDAVARARECAGGFAPMNLDLFRDSPAGWLVRSVMLQKYHYLKLMLLFARKLTLAVCSVHLVDDLHQVARTVILLLRELLDQAQGLLGRVLLLVGALPPADASVVDHTRPFPAPIPPGVTVEYGRYLATVGGCVGCHGPGLSGGRVPGVPPDFPPAANITPSGPIGQWSEADFFRALREGKRPNGAEINPFMPWQASGKMTDDEIRAVWQFLKSVPARPSGTR